MHVKDRYGVCQPCGDGVAILLILSKPSAVFLFLLASIVLGVPIGVCMRDRKRKKCAQEKTDSKKKELGHHAARLHAFLPVLKETKPKLMVKYKILVGMMQIINGLSNAFDTEEQANTPTLKDTTDGLSFIELNLPRMLPMECQVKLNAGEQMLLTTLLPISIVSFLLMLNKICTFLSARLEGHWLSGACTTVAGMTTQLTLTIIFLVYVACSSRIFDILSPNACITYWSHDGDSVSFFKKDLSLNCNSPEFASYRAWAWLLLFVYPLGTPALYIVLYYKNHKVLTPLIDGEKQQLAATQLLKLSRKQTFRKRLLPPSQADACEAARTTQSRRSTTIENASTKVKDGLAAISNFVRSKRTSSITEEISEQSAFTSTGTRHSTFRSDLQEVVDTASGLYNAVDVKKHGLLPDYLVGLVAPYDYTCYWFETFECIRKLSLTGITCFFPSGSIEQLVVGLILCVFLSWVLHNVKPYRSNYDDTLAQIAQGAVFIILTSKIVLQDPYYASKSRQTPKPTSHRLFDMSLTLIFALPFVLAAALLAFEARQTQACRAYLEGPFGKKEAQEAKAARDFERQATSQRRKARVAQVAKEVDELMQRKEEEARQIEREHANEVLQHMEREHTASAAAARAEALKASHVMRAKSGKQVAAMREEVARVKREKDEQQACIASLQMSNDSLQKSQSALFRRLHAIAMKNAEAMPESEEKHAQTLVLAGEQLLLANKLTSVENEKQRLLGEKESLLREHTCLLSEKDVMQHERDVLLSERAAWQREKATLVRETEEIKASFPVCLPPLAAQESMKGASARLQASHSPAAERQTLSEESSVHCEGSMSTRRVFLPIVSRCGRRQASRNTCETSAGGGTQLFSEANCGPLKHGSVGEQ